MAFSLLLRSAFALSGCLTVLVGTVVTTHSSSVASLSPQMHPHLKPQMPSEAEGRLAVNPDEGEPLMRPWSPGTLRGALLDEAAGGHRDGSPVRAVAFSPDGQVWASGSTDRTVKIWSAFPVDNRMPPPLQSLTNHPDHLTSIAFSPDGQWLASATFDGSIVIWNWRTGERVQQWSQYLDGEGRKAVAQLAFSPDGRWLVTSMGDETLKLWDMSSLEQGNDITLWGELDTPQSVQALAFSPDGMMLASAGIGRTVDLWDMTEQALIRRLGPYDRAIYDIEFSPDGQHLIFSPDALAVSQAPQLDEDREYNTVRLWDLEGTPVGESLSGHQDYVTSVAVSPDGQTLLSGSWDLSTVVWDVVTGAQVHRFTENSKRVLSIAFSPNNDRFVLGSGDGTVQLFFLRDEYSSPLLEVPDVAPAR